MTYMHIKITLPSCVAKKNDCIKICAFLEELGGF